jgi:hypothetical protein
MQKNFIVTLFVFISSFQFSCSASNPNQIFIRANQVGFLPEDIKSAVVFSEYPLYSKEFKILNVQNGKTIFESEVSDSGYNYSKFSHCYTVDFSELNKPGMYLLEIDGQKSYPFKIDKRVFNSVRDSLMIFFSVQRCGPTNPYLHGPCHLSDVARLIGDPDTEMADLTGGWHDAGDYLKFLSTTAYTTYMLIFSYEFNKQKFGFDNNKDGVPDVLAEARVGIDWLLRCNYDGNKLVTQVQDLRDHDVGWRMPEEDTLRYDRPGFVAIGKNQIGMFSAALALASKVWAERFLDYEFAEKCLNAAEKLYQIRNNVPDIDESPSGFYQDNHFYGKLALAAIELFLTTKDEQYLLDAKEYADSADSDYWWSWGNLNSLAHYRLGKIEPRYIDYIANSLRHYDETKNSSIFKEGIPYSWGTTNSLLGVTLQAILYKHLTGKNDFDSLAVYQRDYVLGRNPWGISFIYNIGSVFPKNFHSQIAYFKGGYLPGALSAGPAPLDLLENYNIERTNFTYDYFNTDSIKYYDDRMDYITNEPTIVGNATALFVYGYYSNR